MQENLQVSQDPVVEMEGSRVSNLVPAHGEEEGEQEEDIHPPSPPPPPPVGPRPRSAWAARRINIPPDAGVRLEDWRKSLMVQGSRDGAAGSASAAAPVEPQNQEDEASPNDPDDLMESEVDDDDEIEIIAIVPRPAPPAEPSAGTGGLCPQCGEIVQDVDEHFQEAHSDSIPIPLVVAEDSGSVILGDENSTAEEEAVEVKPTPTVAAVVASSSQELISGRIFKCKECGLEFPSQYKLKKHRSDEHANFKCDHCTIKYFKKVTLEKHLREKHASPAAGSAPVPTEVQNQKAEVEETRAEEPHPKRPSVAPLGIGGKKFKLEPGHSSEDEVTFSVRRSTRAVKAVKKFSE